MPVAWITGIAGQDGSYLAELLLEKGYRVHGLVREGRGGDHPNLRQIASRLLLEPGDITNRSQIMNLVEAIQPDEIYHLAGQSQPGRSFEHPCETVQANALGTLHILESCRLLKRSPRLFNAGTCQVFGRPKISPQTEETPVHPLSPYAASKALASDLVRIERETRGLFAVNGILYNHESPRRGPEFVTGKVCRAAAAIRQGLQKELVLGDLSIQRDWGDARDFVDGYWRSLQAKQPTDYIFASGVCHRLQEAIEIAFEVAGIDWRERVKTDVSLYRPAEPAPLVGDYSRAERELGWRPVTPFHQMIRDMTEAALMAVSKA